MEGLVQNPGHGAAGVNRSTVQGAAAGAVLGVPRPAHLPLDFGPPSRDPESLLAPMFQGMTLGPRGDAGRALPAGLGQVGHSAQVHGSDQNGRLLGMEGVGSVKRSAGTVHGNQSQLQGVNLLEVCSRQWMQLVRVSQIRMKWNWNGFAGESWWKLRRTSSWRSEGGSGTGGDSMSYHSLSSGWWSGAAVVKTAKASKVKGNGKEKELPDKIKEEQAVVEDVPAATPPLPTKTSVPVTEDVKGTGGCQQPAGNDTADGPSEVVEVSEGCEAPALTRRMHLEPLTVWLNRGNEMPWNQFKSSLHQAQHGSLQTWEPSNAVEFDTGSRLFLFTGGCPTKDRGEALALLREMEKQDGSSLDVNDEDLTWWRQTFPETPERILRKILGQGGEWDCIAVE
eukprot:s4653_g6.t1